MKSLNVYDQNQTDIQKQADITSKAILEYHMNNPTKNTSEFIRKYLTCIKI